MKNTIYSSLLLILFAYTPLVDARIYKWVDENGKTVYGEKPPFDTSREKIKEIKVRSSSEKVTTETEEQDTEQSEKKQETESQESETKEKAAQKAKKRKELARYCAELRSRITTLQSKSRLTETDKNGKKVLIRKNKRAAEMTKARNNLNKYCR